MSGILKALLTIESIERTAGGRYKRGLQKRIEALMGNHDATKEEIENLYNHIIMEILNK
jgi:hypothetical protein